MYKHKNKNLYITDDTYKKLSIINKICYIKVYPNLNNSTDKEIKKKKKR
jgi:hypothetical protein